MMSRRYRLLATVCEDNMISLWTQALESEILTKIMFSAAYGGIVPGDGLYTAKLSYSSPIALEVKTSLERL